MEKYRIYFSETTKEYFYCDVEAENCADAMQIVDSGRHAHLPKHEDRNMNKEFFCESEEWEKISKNGVYNKFTVNKTEGGTDPKAKYFVLRLDRPSNISERKALRHYAGLIRNVDKDLSEGIVKFLETLR